MLVLSNCTSGHVINVLLTYLSADSFFLAENNNSLPGGSKDQIDSNYKSGEKKKIRKISGTWKLHGTFHWNQKSGRTWKIYQISLFVIPHHSKMFAQRSKAMTQKSDFNISILVMAKTESVCSNKSNSKYFTYSIVTSVQNMTFSHSFKKYHKTT